MYFKLCLHLGPQLYSHWRVYARIHKSFIYVETSVYHITHDLENFHLDICLPQIHEGNISSIIVKRTVTCSNLIVVFQPV